ncbi:CheR family methyltransferase [Microcoleus sp. FACHB-672]|uniref:CheR family methyltransferase n=1 Tax=Microcoleus sp. FACHB-672 TaxID=2692825 RepID=UPI0016856163|nr:protein-glutamate O-methyltransferase CheR [Microcoleus sp. FACHB-672]MBD2042209.1 protein-glutamate O-methyltransferase CheR [Microcoleus sp. FACHB-672]
MISNTPTLNLPENSNELPFEDGEAFETFLNYFWEEYGFNFTYYKRANLMRRVGQRMKSLALSSYKDYIKYLKAHSEESTALLKFIPINHTCFFRDAETWDHITTDVIPHIIANQKSDELIKVWSAGCASGEETYTLAILLIEALGVEQFNRQVRIYGTDIDPEALYLARQGKYSQNQMVGVPPVFQERYFEEINQSYIFRKEFRHPIVFAQSSLLENAPISQVDLLVCRNTLMYFNVSGQNRVLYRFHFGLKNKGILVLGNKERPNTGIDNVFFSGVSQQNRIYKKVSTTYSARQLIEAFQQRRPGEL